MIYSNKNTFTVGSLNRTVGFNDIPGNFTFEQAVNQLRQHVDKETKFSRKPGAVIQVQYTTFFSYSIPGSIGQWKTEMIHPVIII